MTPKLWTRTEIALIAAIIAFACAAAFLSVRLTRPKPFVSVIVNPQWQCSTTTTIPAICIRKHA